MAVLSVDGLKKSFDELVAVDDVSFHIEEGETFGLLGPNGAGKTTTISVVAGILEADAGAVSVAGKTVSTKKTAAKAEIGLVPQDIAVYTDLTGTENLNFFGRLYGITGSDLSKRVDEILDVIGLRERGGDRVKEYSGGMKRRLNIGIGLLHRPSLLILDEPTVGVDPQSRNAILESVEILSEGGTAVLYTTHYMEEAERLCDRVAIIDHGKVMAEGTRRDLISLVGTSDHISLRAEGDLAAAAAAARAVGNVGEVIVSDHALEVMTPDGSGVLPHVLSAVTAAGANVQSVEVTEPDLETVFLYLTGRALRD
jgi:ABC-2 type transport system ATP-binding protein